MLATLASAFQVVAEVVAVAVLIAKARRWESIADLRERLARLEALIDPDPEPAEDTPPCSPS